MAESEEIRERISDKAFYAATGRRNSPFLLAPKIRWLKKNRPDIFNRIQTIIGLKDDIVRRLTGQILTDMAHFDYSGLYNVYQAKLDPVLLDTLEIDEHLFPSTNLPTRIAGTLTMDAGKKTGLPPGTPVVTGSTDGTTAMYGAGVMERDNAVLVSGTTDVLMLGTERAVKDNTCTLNINTGILPNSFLVGGPMGSSGGTLNWFEDMLGTSMDPLEKKMTALSAGADGLLFFPGLTGERSPYWKEHLTAGMVGLTDRHRKEHLLRAIMEGCAYRIGRLLEILAQNGLSPRALTVVGGGAGNNLWNQIRADVTGLEVVKPAVTEATCLGTALFCHAAMDERRTLREISESWRTDSTRYLPRESQTAVYRKLAQLFTTYIETNETLFKRLNGLKPDPDGNKKWKER
jgi:xylulokinase